MLILMLKLTSNSKFAPFEISVVPADSWVSLFTFVNITFIIFTDSTNMLIRTPLIILAESKLILKADFSLCHCLKIYVFTLRALELNWYIIMLRPPPL